jgi:membrane protein required for colicin V production
MTLLDAGILLILALSVALAATQGFFYEIFSLAGVVLGYLGATWFYHSLASWFLPYVKAPQFADMAAFLTIFFATVIFAGMVARLARWTMKEAGLRWVDRVLGGAFGLVRGVVVVTVAVIAFAAFAPDSPELARSRFGTYFLVAARTATWIAPSELRERVRSGSLALRDLAPRQAELKPSPGTLEAPKKNANDSAGTAAK